MKQTNILVESEQERIDAYLAKIFPDYSRSYFGKLIADRKVLLNSLETKASQRLKTGDQITIHFQELPKITDLKPENIDLDIIYEDDNVIAVNKPADMVVHPAGNKVEKTLVNALLAHFPQIKEAVYEKGNEISESRPGLVHRLDKDTTGIIVIAKNNWSMHSIAKQIQNRTVRKIYFALLYGWPKEEKGRLTNCIGRDANDRKTMTEVGEAAGKLAISDYEVIEYLEDEAGNKISYVKFDIKTGRTHQIRTQSKLFFHPIIGDPVYDTKESKAFSDKIGASRQMLHAYQFTFTLPGEKKETTFVAPIPADFSSIKEKFSKIA